MDSQVHLESEIGSFEGSFGTEKPTSAEYKLMIFASSVAKDRGILSLPEACDLN